MSGCCNPRPWQPICVGCPDRRFATAFAPQRRSGNPYARIDEDPSLPRSVVVVELPECEEGTMPAQRRRPRVIVDCLRCKRNRPHGGRGLCTSCHLLTGPPPHGDGTRESYPRRIRLRREDTLEDYKFLRDQGLGIPDIAAQLHVSEQYLRGLIRGSR